MKIKGVEAEKLAYRFTRLAIMKFQPQADYEEPKAQAPGLIDRIRTYFSPPSRNRSKSPLRRLNSLASIHPVNPQNGASLKYVRKLSNEHVLVGNEDQLDGMGLGGIVGDFVDTDFLWSINIGKAILHVTVDLKKNYIVLVASGELIIYAYDSHNIRTNPRRLGSINLSQEVFFLQVVKESVFAICLQKVILVLTVGEEGKIRLTAQKGYGTKEGLHLIQVPTPYQSILNLFFGESLEKGIIALWQLEVEFLEKQIRVGRPLKVYEIIQALRKNLRFQNFSRDVFLIHLGQKLLAVRRGYVIDSAVANASNDDWPNALRYLSQRLLHVAPFKIELYSFSLDLTVSPPKIILSSNDSIPLPPQRPNFEFFDLVEILGDNFAVFFQEKSGRGLKGQIRYGIVVTQRVRLQQKIKSLLPEVKQEKDLSSIEEKADMAGKMGLKRKQIYLRLWNSSDKTQLQDFKFLLDTLDYETVRNQVEKKLKKSSMNLRQVLLLEQGCLSMLAQNVFGVTPTSDHLRNYLVSHFFIRKLELFRKFTIVDKASKTAEKSFKVGVGEEHKRSEPEGLLINIQNYNHFKTVDIRALLLELITRYCIEGKDEIAKIRIVLRSFQFSLRAPYQDILREIVSSTKKKFLHILQAVPELLPYDPYPDEAAADPAISELWADVSPQQWQKNLFIDSVGTIDNKEALAQVCGSVWFLRQWLTLHDFLNKNRAEIEELHDRNRSEETFYAVLEQVFEVVRQPKGVRDIVDFIQRRYERMPQHIFGKIFLYRKIFQHFQEHEDTKKNKELTTFGAFLRLRDDEIFRVMFNYQKVRKGFILKQMKPVYARLAGPEVFNEGLLNYFASDRSEISDIKYLLNRMNNQKEEFHIQNEGIYEVLVRGMQIKLRLGGPKDTPIEQVLIYIQNIPLSQNNPVMQDLQIMNLINKDADRFRRIGLDMSIFEMTRNIDSVIAALVNYDVEQAGLLAIRDYEQIQRQAYRIIADVQTVKEKIFARDQHTDLTLFSFLTRLLEEQKLIPQVAKLLADPWINKYYNCDQIMIENLVLYMHKWKLSATPAYVFSRSYLQDLVTLLPPNNTCRQYIEAELEVALLLSTSEEPVQYPLSGDQGQFSALELQGIVNRIGGKHLLGVSVEQLHEAALKVQEIGSDGEFSDITLHGVYEMVIFRLIDTGFLKQTVLPMRTLLELQGETPYNFIYPAILVVRLAPELIDENRKLLLQTASLLFRSPSQLLDILQKLMSLRLTSAEYKNLLARALAKATAQFLPYSLGSAVLEPLYLRAAEEIGSEALSRAISASLERVLSCKDEFKSKPEYWLMFTMLVNDPFVLIKYVYSYRFSLDIKEFRCFLSYLIREDIFSQAPLLEFGKRLFQIVWTSISARRNLEALVEEARGQPLSMLKQIERPSELPTNELQKKLLKSIDRLKGKIKAVSSEIEKAKNRGQLVSEEERLKRIEAKLKEPIIGSRPEYPFHDSDDNPEKKEAREDKEAKLVSLRQAFDAKFQRARLMGRKKKNLGLYVSMQKQRNQRDLYYTQKNMQDGIFSSLKINPQLQNALVEGLDQLIDVKPKGKLRIARAETQYVDLMTFHKQPSVNALEVEDIQEQEDIIVENQEEYKRNDAITIIGNISEQNTLLDDLFEKGPTGIQDGFFDQYSGKQNFKIFLHQLVELGFSRPDLPLGRLLECVSAIAKKYEVLGLNKDSYDIYVRAQGLQNKFKLQLPLKDILKAEGMFLEESVQGLFNLLLPSILEKLNDSNIHKICKLITLAFKRTELQAEIHYHYLLVLLANYQRDYSNPAFDDSQARRQGQKIAGILDKIPIKILKNNDEQILGVLHDEQLKKQVANLIVESFRKRYDNKMAQLFHSKWVKKARVFDNS